MSKISLKNILKKTFNKKSKKKAKKKVTKKKVTKIKKAGLKTSKVKSGNIISIDLKEMDKIENTIQIKGDFTKTYIQSQIKSFLKNGSDVVMSDMAVNTTGIKNIDSIQTGELCMEAMNFSKEVLSNKGFFISKIFMGGTFNEIVALGKKFFKEVKVFKPKSSRKDSKESFIICKNLR